MKVHIIKTTEFSDVLFKEIFIFLKLHKSPIEFVMGETSLQFVLNEKYLFEEVHNHCKHFRNEKNIPANDVVLLLGSNSTYSNWFLDYDFAGNLYVIAQDISTSDNLIPQKYFFLYEIVCKVLQYLIQADIFDEEQWEKSVHITTQCGCVNDHCLNTNMLRLKLKSSDICTDCCRYAIEKGVSSTVLAQFKAILARIRLEMITKPKLMVEDLSDLVYNTRTKRLYLKDDGIELALTPLYKVIYIFFLRYPEGKNISQMQEKYVDELYEIYKSISPRSKLEDMKETILNLFEVKSAL